MFFMGIVMINKSTPLAASATVTGFALVSYASAARLFGPRELAIRTV